MALELHIMTIEVSGAAVSLRRWQAGDAILREPTDDDIYREVPVPSGFEVVISAALLDPEQALTFAQAIESVARRAIHLRNLEGERL